MGGGQDLLKSFRLMHSNIGHSFHETVPLIRFFGRLSGAWNTREKFIRVKTTGTMFKKAIVYIPLLGPKGAVRLKGLLHEIFGAFLFLCLNVWIWTK